MDSLAIFGVGLIGGSFALALRAAGFQGEIAGVSSPATIKAALERGVIDREVTVEEAREFDLIFLAQPIRGILAALPQLAGSRAWVTDAGSTKRTICRAASVLERFTGGHPMAGKAARGLEHADAGLFAGRPWILTSTPPPALAALLESTGARITITTPEEHDRAVALTSHLPQLLSSALAAQAAAHPALLFAAGPGWESMTRLAASDWALWRDILETNADYLLAAWQELRDRLDPALAALHENTDPLGELFAAGQLGPSAEHPWGARTAPPVPEPRKEFAPRGGPRDRGNP